MKKTIKQEISVCDFCGLDNTETKMYSCPKCGKDVCVDCSADFDIAYNNEEGYEEHKVLNLCPNCYRNFEEWIKEE